MVTSYEDFGWPMKPPVNLQPVCSNWHHAN
jgi:hypothetical protein